MPAVEQRISTQVQQQKQQKQQQQNVLAKKLTYTSVTNKNNNKNNNKTRKTPTKIIKAPTVGMVAWAGHSFQPIDPSIPIRYNFVYLSSPYLPSEVRKRLRILVVAQARVLDIHFPTKGVVGLLIPNSFQTKLESAFAKGGIKLIPQAYLGHVIIHYFSSDDYSGQHKLTPTMLAEYQKHRPTPIRQRRELTPTEVAVTFLTSTPPTKNNATNNNNKGDDDIDMDVSSSTKSDTPTEPPVVNNN
ncbi:hypothetical protein INT45_010987 [Circinella minor]|uniref:Uncharacterized protein n=1 Tax=Circinella minor TaxID=1195481 RepID=A0A8H7VB09_9FUNG|nr:hypothetical protein INT45_010987 [Circinella minor]